jgi:RNA polymerase sigma-70 factor (ECF subfamily)
MEEKSDQQLIKEFLKGNEDSLRELFGRHLSSVYSFISHLSSRQADADDVVQEAFVKVWKNLKRYDPSKPFRTWLFTIAKNTLLDHVKKQKQFVFSLDDKDSDGQPWNEPLDEKPLPDEVLSNDESEKKIFELVDELVPAQKAVILLHVTEGMTFKEIGEILDTPMETVKTRYRRGVRILYEKLSGQGR